MKILFLSPRFYPRVGGVEKHAIEISRELIKKGHQVTIITEAQTDQRINPNSNYHSQPLSDKQQVNKKSIVESSFFEYIKQDQIDIYYIKFGEKGWFKKFRIWYALWKLKNLIRENDIIHCHDVFFWYLPFRFLFPYKKVFITFHGYETVFPPKKRAILIRRLSNKLSWGSISIGSYIEKWYGTKSNVISYGGIDPTTLLTKNVRRIKSPYMISFIGRLEEDTGGRTYLKILKELKKNNIHFTFNAYGDGKLRKLFEEYGTVHGFISDTSLYLKEADIVFASSYLSILEAFAAKKLVISVYDNELKHDYLTLTPFKEWLIIGHDITEIIPVMVQYLKDPLVFSTQLDRENAWVNKQTWEALTKHYLALWNSL